MIRLQKIVMLQHASLFFLLLHNVILQLIMEHFMYILKEYKAVFYIIEYWKKLEPTLVEPLTWLHTKGMIPALPANFRLG